MGLKAIGYAQTIIGYIGGLFSPASLNPRQWLFSQTEPDEVDDKSTNLIDANYVGSPATVWDGVAGILVTELVGSETVVSSGGTSTPSISAGQIDFTSGTCWDLVLSNGSVYPLQEESGSSVYDTVNGYTGTINGGTVSVIRAGTQDVSHPFAFDGGSKVIAFDGASSILQSPAECNAIHQTGIYDITMTCVFDDITSVELGGTAFPPNPITANGIRIGLDSGSLVFVLIYDATGTRALTHSGGPAITTGLHTIRVWSTDGVTSNIQIDNDTPDTATFDHTPSNSNTATVDYVLGATAGGGAYHLSHISADGFFEYSGASSYGTTAPDLSGNGNDGVLTDADIVYYPALADGTDDVAGLGIRNKGGYIHNNGSFDIQQDVITRSAAVFATVHHATVVDGSGVTGYPFRLRSGLSFTSSVAVASAVSLSDTAVVDKYFHIGTTSAGKIELVCRNGTAYSVTSPASYDDGAFYCVEGRFISPTNHELWIGTTWNNLAKVAENTSDSTTFFTPTNTSVGANITTTPVQLFTGNMTEASVYSDAGTTIGSSYTFIESGGSTIYDVSGNANHLTLTGTTSTFWAATTTTGPHWTVTNGYSGEGVFNGITSRVTGLTPSAGGTLSMDAWMVCGPSCNDDPVYHSGQASEDAWGVFMVGGSGKVHIEMGDGGNYYKTGTSLYSKGNLVHVVVTWDGSSVAKCYIDGVDSALSVGGGAPYDPSGMTTARIGRATEIGITYFDGEIYRVRNWDEVLDQTRVTALFSGGIEADDTTGLVDDFRFSEENISGTTISNNSTNADGTLTNIEVISYPALADVSDDVVGLGLLTPATAVAGLLDSDLFYTNGSANLVDWSDILAWSSYSDDYTWLKFAEVGGRCYLSDSIIIDIAADASAHSSMVSWKGGAGCGEDTAPF